ncbi:MAG: metalloprotease TldD, partial [Kordiimonadaceae bacterium]|nr:metalloprotease TldD [Kordiimonadaceae bacterium]
MTDTNGPTSDTNINFFFDQSELDENRTESLVSTALSGMDDGELYLESTQSESFTFDDGRLKGASFDSSQGFGLRGVSGESTGYAHSTELSEAAIKRAAETIRAVKTGSSGEMSLAPARTNKQLYTDQNPLGGIAFDKKVSLLEEIDAYTRAQDPRIKQVTASILGSWQAVEIIRADGHRVRDIRPLVRLNVGVVMGKG